MEKPTRHSHPCYGCDLDSRGQPTGFALKAGDHHPRKCLDCNGTGIDPHAWKAWKESR